MILNRSHIIWFWLTLLASALSVVLFMAVFHAGMLPAALRLPLPGWVSPKYTLHTTVGYSPLGLAYGIIAYAIFIFAVLLNTRKKYPTIPVGRAQTWLRAHIWLTVLTLPLVFLHANFRFGGPMTSSLMWLYLLVMLSGFYGLALQQLFPRIIKDRITLETIFEEIPYLRRQLLHSAEKMRAELSPALAGVGAGVKTTAFGAGGAASAEDDPSTAAMVDAIESNVIPYLKLRKGKGHKFNEKSYATEYFRQLNLRTAADQHERTDLLAAWCEERRQMDLQTSYHHWLHGWLLVHVPASFLLLIYTGWHAVTLLVYY